jgi:hypothetical protein
MQKKDFSILFEKLPTTGSKTDIAVVNGYNSVVQKINHLFNTNKGELVSDEFFGSNLFTYLFDPVGEKPIIESNLESYIQTFIPQLLNIKVFLINYNENFIDFKVTFSYFDDVKIYDNITCFIKVNT